MINFVDNLYISSILLIITSQSKRNYQFEAYISLLPWSGTVDEIYFRLCNQNDICGSFQSVPAGWQSIGQTYSYSYTTSEDIGDIYKVQIVHPGSDMLCIGHIKVNGIEYDENEFDWIDWPHCIEEADGGGCDTVTIILPDNYWHSVLTIPCEFQHQLHATQPPLQSPTNNPTISPTNYPTISPTNNPTNYPTISPTIVTISSDEGSTMTGEYDSALANVHNGNVDSVVIGAIIGGLIALVLCLCLIIVTLVYCLRKRRNMNDGVCAQSIINSEEGIDCVMTTKTLTGSYMGENVSMLENQNKEKVQLIEDDSSDDEGLYDNQRRNMTQMVPLDDSDVDEDVVPQ